jgi:chorismate dehydratase
MIQDPTATKLSIPARPAATTNPSAQDNFIPWGYRFSMFSVSRGANLPSHSRLRIGSVSFLNAKPLIWGLEKFSDLQMKLAVPSRLLDDLSSNQCDIALLPVIDYQRDLSLPLKVVPSGGIGSDGTTLTVRIFSPKPIDQIETLACDLDSHTSVALAQVILARRFGKKPKLIDLPGNAGDSNQAVLLIGDKVVCQEPPKMPHQLDLGEAWKQLTGLPFVFAIWTARGDADLGDLPARLEEAKRIGMTKIEEIVAEHAITRGWPADLARRYLTQFMQYDIGEKQLEAMRLFYRMAYEEGIISRPREIRVY